MADFDEKDKQILNLLLEKPGITQKEIGEKIGIRGPSVNNRIQKMKKQKIITGYTPTINAEKLGYDVTVVVNVKIKGGKLTITSEKYATDPHVCALYTISGEYDMVIVAKFHNRSELQEWNEKMTQDTEHIERVNTSLCFSTPREATNPNKIE